MRGPCPQITILFKKRGKCNVQKDRSVPPYRGRTRAKLLQSAAEEFAKYALQKSPLRRLCANAGVTTGTPCFFPKIRKIPFSGAISPVTERVPEVLRRHYMPGACRSAREPYEEGKCGFLRGAGDPEVLLIIRQNRLRDSAEPPGASGRNPLFESFDGNNGLPDRCVFEAPSP